jgi:hypothetical protein
MVCHWVLMAASIVLWSTLATRSSLHPMTCKTGNGVIQWGIGKAYDLSGPIPAGTLWTARCRNIFQRGKLLTKKMMLQGYNESH